jgi:hypothetical protein
VNLKLKLVGQPLFSEGDFNALEEEEIEMLLNATTQE